MATSPSLSAPARIKEELYEVKAFVGSDALELLRNLDFQEKWDELYHSCPWGTVFQSSAFVTTWYNTYEDSCFPIIIKAESDDTLHGLITLTKNRRGMITGAGESQAEYQVWLSSESEGERFIKSALTILLKQFPESSLQLKYIPASAPVSWVKKDNLWNKHAILQQVKQPLIEIEEKKIDSELRKKNRREKINRLKRLGELKFERIIDRETFDTIFDQLALQYEFRKGAVFNSSVFKTDPLRKQFLTQLFEKGLLHTTVFKVGGDIIASNVGATGKGWVHLQGLNTHDPTYARYSPGILHFLLLGSLLAEEGVEVFDLTPGTDTYKAGLATKYVEVFQLNVQSIYQRYVRYTKQKLARSIKGKALKMGYNAAELKKTKWRMLMLEDKFKSSGLSSFIKGILQEYLLKKKNKIYKIEVSHKTFSDIAPACNSLSDLLEYEGVGRGQSRWEFLADAMRRLEAGERCYTWSDQGRLLACAWLRSPKGGASAVLEGVYCHSSAREALPAFLQAAAAKVKAEQNLDPVYALAGNAYESLLSVFLATPAAASSLEPTGLHFK